MIFLIIINNSATFSADNISTCLEVMVYYFPVQSEKGRTFPILKFPKMFKGELKHVG